jgi:hypothetical protein
MAKTKTKRKTTRQSKAKPSAFNQALTDMQTRISDWFGELNLGNRLARGGLTVFITLVVLGGVCFGLKQLEGYVNQLPIFTSSEVSVSLYNQPGWMSEPLAEQILKESFLPIQEELRELHRQGQDNKLSEVLAGELVLNPWVNKVFWVRLGFGGKVVISAEFREPTALVNRDDGCFLIDENGYLLPGKYKYDALVKCGILEIHGVKGRIPDAGAKWTGGDLQSGLGLVKLLKSAPFRHQIKAVDVTNFEGRCDRNSSWLVLETDRNTIIRWGRPAGEERGLENTARDKLALVAGAYADYKHIDCNRMFIDIRRSQNAVDASIASVGRPIEN